MRRAWLLWIAFGLCLALALAAMAWISVTVVRLEMREQEARQDAQIEENIRLALWRMDSILAPLIGSETARPYFEYSAFMPAERAYTRMFSEIGYGEVLMPSPLLSAELPLVLLHFQFGPDGALSSPQVPTGNMRDLAGQYTTRERIEECAHRLEQIGRSMTRQRLLAVLPADALELGCALPAPEAALPEAPPVAQEQAFGAAQQVRSQIEYQARDRVSQTASNFEYLANRVMSRGPEAQRVREGLIKPLWLDEALLLVRWVSVNDDDYIQGCWLDWPAIRQTLLAGVADLLPGASLEPSAALTPERQPRQLATIPVNLIPGPIGFGGNGSFSPVRTMLAIAWGCVLIGSLAVGSLLWGAMRLSERRGAFVSAVTHELRTPLTTVSMYAEMLEEGMVSDEKQRRQYLSTLRAEADRLGHLVENVLAYSRIERGRLQGRIQDVPLSELIEGAGKRLADRAEHAKMQMVFAVAPGAESTAVRADPSAVEQILFNLVDNAGKYAASAVDRRIHLEAAGNGASATIRVRDHGPGISAQDGRRLFRPFSKSANEAAHSAPGVGLGLALSRRLAREMGGELSLEKAGGEGASFLLTLPVA